MEGRAAVLERAAAALGERMVELGELISHEAGTPMPGAIALQAGIAPSLFGLYAQVARSYAWESRVGDRIVTLTAGYGFEERPGGSLVLAEPIGVVGAITPWNYPLTLAAYKVAPALAAGCTVVLKPSELAPLSAFALAEILEGSGLPPGVLNVVTGFGIPVGERLAGHPDVDMVTFTGSTGSGAKVAAAAAATIKRVHLELGGKSAAVVLPDADLGHAVAATIQQLLMNSGQTCVAWSRLLVPRDRQEEAADIAARVLRDGFSVGAGDGVPVGPMVSAQQQERVREFIDGAIADGARLVSGGSAQPSATARGYYVEPTVFADVRPGMRIAQEEVFGPVLSILPYDRSCSLSRRRAGCHTCSTGPIRSGTTSAASPASAACCRDRRASTSAITSTSRSLRTPRSRPISIAPSRPDPAGQRQECLPARRSRVTCARSGSPWCATARQSATAACARRAVG